MGMTIKKQTVKLLHLGPEELMVCHSKSLKFLLHSVSQSWWSRPVLGSEQVKDILHLDHLISLDSYQTCLCFVNPI